MLNVNVNVLLQSYLLNILVAISSHHLHFSALKHCCRCNNLSHSIPTLDDLALTG